MLSVQTNWNAIRNHEWTPELYSLAVQYLKQVEKNPNNKKINGVECECWSNQKKSIFRNRVMQYTLFNNKLYVRAYDTSNTMSGPNTVLYEVVSTDQRENVFPHIFISRKNTTGARARCKPRA